MEYLFLEHTFRWLVEGGVLLMGLLFHLCLEYAFNLPMLQWDILTAYVLFIDPADLDRVWHAVRQRLKSQTPAPNLSS